MNAFVVEPHRVLLGIGCADALNLWTQSEAGSLLWELDVDHLAETCERQVTDIMAVVLYFPIPEGPHCSVRATSPKRMASSQIGIA